MRKHPEKEYPENAKSLFGGLKKNLENRTQRVYAGPEQIPVQCVYAGPEYFEKRKPDAEMLDVYAGPVFFEDRQEENADPFAETEEEQKKKAEIAAKNITACVYAGPDYFDNSLRNKETGKDFHIPAGFVTVESSETAADKPESDNRTETLPPGTETVVCPACGETVTSGRFCPNCGMPLPKSEPEA